MPKRRPSKSKESHQQKRTHRPRKARQHAIRLAAHSGRLKALMVRAQHCQSPEEAMQLEGVAKIKQIIQTEILNHPAVVAARSRQLEAEKNVNPWLINWHKRHKIHPDQILAILRGPFSYVSRAIIQAHIDFTRTHHRQPSELLKDLRTLTRLSKRQHQLALSLPRKQIMELYEPSVYAETITLPLLKVYLCKKRSPFRLKYQKAIAALFLNVSIGIPTAAKHTVQLLKAFDPSLAPENARSFWNRLYPDRTARL